MQIEYKAKVARRYPKDGCGSELSGCEIYHQFAVIGFNHRFQEGHS